MSFTNVAFESNVFDTSAFDLDVVVGGASFSPTAFSATAFGPTAFSLEASAGSGDYRPFFTAANYTQANYFGPSVASTPPSVVSGPRMRGLIPGRLPGLNSGLIF